LRGKYGGIACNANVLKDRDLKWQLRGIAVEGGDAGKSAKYDIGGLLNLFLVSSLFSQP
jgi:hypothetical protein